MNAQLINGATSLVGLIGHPVAHSISPLIHNHAFSKMEVNAAYIPMDIAPQKLHSAVYALRTMNFLGANVTIPHKRSVISYCDTVTELVRTVGSVNTLYLRDGMLCGDTTDATGFIRALESHGHTARKAHVVIMGNGGAARSIAFGLALGQLPARISIVGRNQTRIASLAKDISRSSAYAVDTATFEDPRVHELCGECTLLVNCTPVGMHPHTNASPIKPDLLHGHMHVFDTIYNPVKTRLLHDATGKGCSVQNGLLMLLYQGLASFELWTGMSANESLFDCNELAEYISS